MNPLLHYLRHGLSEGRAAVNSYGAWLAACDQLDARDRKAIKRRIASLPQDYLLAVGGLTYHLMPQTFAVHEMPNDF